MARSGVHAQGPPVLEKTLPGALLHLFVTAGHPQPASQPRREQGLLVSLGFPTAWKRRSSTHPEGRAAKFIVCCRPAAPILYANNGFTGVQTAQLGPHTQERPHCPSALPHHL